MDSVKQIDITVLSGVSAGDVFHFELEEGTPIVVGRSVDSQIVLQDAMVSRRHAEIEWKNGGVYISDLGSTHGTVHMGFRLESGSDAARRLQDNDEFKIAELLFRVNFEDDEIQTSGDNLETLPKAIAAPKLEMLSKIPPYESWTKQQKFIVILSLLLVFSLLLIPSDGGAKLPRQRSNVVLNIPQMRVLGYWKWGRKKADKDLSHIDKVQFRLDASDLVIDFEFRGEPTVDVLLDEALIGPIDPVKGEWQRRQVVVRDVLGGSARKLIFDNRDYPKPKGSKSKRKYWAIRNVRQIPLSRAPETTLDDQLEGTLALTEKMDKTPDSLFNLIRAFQKSIIIAAEELKLDGASYPLDVEGRVPDFRELRGVIQSILEERRDGFASEMALRHFEVMVELCGQLEGELWRRSNSRFTKIRIAAKVKDYIGAHDHILAVRKMIPDELDRRRIYAERMFSNKKIVPKKVRMRPERYRRRR